MLTSRSGGPGYLRVTARLNRALHVGGRCLRHDVDGGRGEKTWLLPATLFQRWIPTLLSFAKGQRPRPSH